MLQNNLELSGAFQEISDLDAEHMSIQEIDDFFKDHEGFPELGKTKDKIIVMKKLRELYPDDDELIEKLLGFRTNKAQIKISPFGFVINITNIWDEINYLNKSLVSFVAGENVTVKVDVDGKSHFINVSIIKTATHDKNESAKSTVHELRHAINYAINSTIRPNIETDWRTSIERRFPKVYSRYPSEHIDMWKQVFQENPDRNPIELAIETIHRIHLRLLRDELLSYIDELDPDELFVGFRLRRALRQHKGSLEIDEYDLRALRHLGIVKTIDQQKQIEQGMRRININQEVKKARNAIAILSKKGYPKDWILIYLAAGENFLADWEKIADITPNRNTEKSAPKAA